MPSPHPTHEHTHSPEGGDHEYTHHHSPTERVLALLGFHTHDMADSVDDELEATADGIRAVKISLVVLGVAATAQALLVILTGSVALLADTIHNFADALTAVPLWIAFALASRPATRRYTYGFGRAEDLAGVFIVALIALSSVVAGWESIRRLLDPQPMTYPLLVMAAGAIGFLGNEVVAIYRIKVGKQIGSAALVADGHHARTDGFTSLAVILGAAGSMLGWQWADPVIGLLITVAIGFVLFGASRDIYRRLMDAIEPAVVENAERALLDTTGVTTVETLRLRWVGHRIRGEASISVPAQLSFVEAHAVAEEARQRLIDDVPKLTDATVHFSPRETPATDHHKVLDRHHDGAL